MFNDGLPIMLINKVLSLKQLNKYSLTTYQVVEVQKMKITEVVANNLVPSQEDLVREFVQVPRHQL